MNGLLQSPEAARTGAPAPGGEEAAVLEVRGLVAHAPDGTKLLDGVTFCVPRGALIGIAGPTGAGKSSLVRVLTGSRPATSGRVVIGGAELSDDPSVRRRIGFVPQESVLHNQLRLGRALGYGAALRLPADVTVAGRSRRVGAVLAELGLERHASVRIGSLSGGQRQRANVAMEMISEPDILILDEPTSSLDPGYEKAVLDTLRGLAGRGHSVLAVTHSMPVLMACDRVLFLAAGGQQAYFGPPRQALAYFGRQNAPDLFAELDDPADRRWGERFRASPDFHCYAQAPSRAAMLAPSPARPAPSGSRQLPNLVRRGLEQIASDRRHSAMIALQGAVLGLLLLTFLGAGGLHPVRGRLLAGPKLAAVSTVAQLLALTVVWLGLASSVREIVKERRMVEREHSAGLSLRAYLGSKFLVLGSISIVEAGILAAIATARQGPPGQGAVLSSGTAELMVTLAAAGLASTALGLLVSAVARSPDKALAGLPVVVVAEFVLSGLQPAVRWVPGLDHLHDLASTYWAIQGIEATVTGDAHGWWVALGALGLTTAATLAAGSALLARGFRPSAGPVLARYESAVRDRWTTSGPASRTAVRGAAAALVVIVVAGSAMAAGLAPIGSRAAVSAAGPARPGYPVQPAPAATGALASAPRAGQAAPSAAPAVGPSPAALAIRTTPVAGPASTSGAAAAGSSRSGAAPASGDAAEPVGRLVDAPVTVGPAQPASRGTPVTTPVTIPVSTPAVTAPPAASTPVARSTPVTTPAPSSSGPVAGPATYPPLASVEVAMAAALAQAWTAQMQAVLHGHLPTGAAPVSPAG